MSFMLPRFHPPEPRLMFPNLTRGDFAVVAICVALAAIVGYQAAQQKAPAPAPACNPADCPHRDAPAVKFVEVPVRTPFRVACCFCDRQLIVIPPGTGKIGTLAAERGRVDTIPEPH